MLHAEQTVTINRRPTDVFDYLADRTNDAQWRTNVVGDYVVTGTDRPWHLAFEVTVGTARAAGRYDLVEEGGVTLIRVALDLEPTGRMRFAKGKIATQLRAEADQLGGLKAVLESRLV